MSRASGDEKKTSGLGGAHLANSPLNLIALREFARRELIKLLDGVKGKMALVVDRAVSGPVNLVADADLLKDHGVVEFHYIQGEGSELESTVCQNVTFLVRPQLRLMHVIAAQIVALKRAAPKLQRKYTVIFAPRRTMLCERALMEEGIFGDITLAELHLDLVPFEEDVLSLELKSSFRECFLEGDPSSLLDVAKSLMKLQAVFGLIPNIKGKGNNAARVWALMQRLRRENPAQFANNTSPEIDTLILIDRQVDMVTPLLTQLTYEGLIDEIFGVHANIIDVDAEVLGGSAKDAPASSPTNAGPVAASTPSGPKKKLVLNSFDSLFKEIRDLNFRVLGPVLHKKAEYVSSTYDERHKAQSVGEMHAFMQKFKTAHAEHNYLQTHINIAERISTVTKSKTFDKRLDIESAMLEGRDSEACEDYIEACIARQDPLVHVLRLLCLLSLTNGGIRARRFDHLRRELIHTYGFEHMFTLTNLERLGLLNRAGSALQGLSAAAGLGARASTSGFQAVRRALKLVAENKEALDLREPKDIGYVFSGYAPLSVRLVELANKPGWRRMPDLMEQLPGRTFEEEQMTGPSPAAGIAGVAGGLSTGLGIAGMATSTHAAHTAGVDKDGRDRKGLGLSNILGSSSQAAVDAALSGDAKSPSATGAAAGSAGSGKAPLTLVYFLGGVTFAEISALRFLAEREGHGRDYIVATTKMINGSTLLESVQERVRNNLKHGTVKP